MKTFVELTLRTGSFIFIDVERIRYIREPENEKEHTEGWKSKASLTNDSGSPDWTSIYLEHTPREVYYKIMEAQRFGTEIQISAIKHQISGWIGGLLEATARKIRQKAETVVSTSMHLTLLSLR